MEMAEVAMLIYKKQFAKYFHYNTLERYVKKRLFRQIGIPAIVINQLSMSE